MATKEGQEFLSTADAAKRLGLTPIRVRQMANQGKLPVVRTASGIRLFRPKDIEAERQRRERALEKKNGQERKRATA